VSIKKTYLFNVSISVLFCIFFSSCSATKFGKKFQYPEILPKDKALVYLYWTDETSFNKRVEFSINANDKQITTMKYGGYYLFEAPPGNLEISSHVTFKVAAAGILDVLLAPTVKINIKIEKGNKYFIRCILDRAIVNYRLEMMTVEEKQGIYEIRDAKLLIPNQTKDTTEQIKRNTKNEDDYTF